MKKPASSPRASRPRVTTVTEVCERHIASRPDPRTGATYRGRLRPLIARYGDLAAPDALARLAEIERELSTECGEQPAHKAATLLKAALTAAGFEPPPLLTLVDARAKHRVAIPSLVALVDNRTRGLPGVRCRARHPHGRGESILFDADELAEDLASLPHCPVEGCEAPGTGPNGYCGEHYGQGGRAGALAAEADLLADKRRDWYTPEEAASLLRESPTTIHSRCKSGELPSEKTGRIRRIPKTAVKQLRKSLAEQPRSRQKRPKPTAEERDAQRERVRELWASPAYEGKAGVIAEELGCSKPTVYARLEEIGIERPGKGRQSRKLPADQRPARQQQVADDYLQGQQSVRQIASSRDVSPTQVARDLDALEIARRPTGGQAKGPPPAERSCAGCGRLFTPEFPCHNEYVFHNDDCARAARASAIKDVLGGLGLLSVSQVAARWAISEHQVGCYIDDGLLKAQAVFIPGWLRPVWGMTPEAAHACEGELVARSKLHRDGDGRLRRARWPEVDQEMERKQRSGEIRRYAERERVSEKTASLVLRDQLEARKRRISPRLAGAKPGKGPPDYHRHWQARYHELEADLLDAWNEDNKLRKERGEAAAERPSRMHVCKALGEEDWRECEDPERWPPADWPASRLHADDLRPDMLPHAGRRVYNALKRLQNPVTGI
ncbi:MAG: hypothetical protein DLM64_04850 [Solirubrobacterales bacterium]|nr:MAG: hypothetical protein DLM64_04850 [Solirubrobacterales bacterium]